MIYLTIGFMTVILNMVGGDPIQSYVRKYIPDSAKRRTWTYFAILLLLSNVSSASRNIGNSPNIIIPIGEVAVIIVCLAMLALMVPRSWSTRKASGNRDRKIIILLLIAAAMFSLEMMNNGMGINSFGDIGGLITVGLMLFTVFM